MNGAIINVPAIFIAALATTICYIGIRQSATFNGFVVAIKVAIVVLVIALAATLIARRKTVLGTSVRAAATLVGGALGFVVAVSVGTQLHSIVTDIGTDNPTRLLVGAIALVLVVGILLVRLVGLAQADGAKIVTLFLGAFVTVLVGAIAPYVFDEIGDGVQTLRYFAFGLALIVMSVFRPQGLLPNRRRATELADRKKEVAVGVNA